MQAPQQIGRYQLRDELGSGGFATVYRAYDPNLERDVALKVLHGHLSRDASVRERFIREGRSLARVEHPNIVSVYDSGEVDGYTFMAMKLIRGKPLEDLARERGGVPLAEIVTVTEQVAAALESVHQQNLVHRDIKPANILIEQGTNRAVLLDLGVARDMMNATMTSGLIVGTPGYMAPEQVQAGGNVTPQTDVYQLAATVYALLAGRPPFEGDTIQVLDAIVRYSPPDLRAIRPDVPAPVVSAIQQGLAKDANQRPRGPRAFAESLRAAFNAAGAPAAPAGATLFAPLQPSSGQFTQPSQPPPPAPAPGPFANQPGYGGPPSGGYAPPPGGHNTPPTGPAPMYQPSPSGGYPAPTGPKKSKLPLMLGGAAAAVLVLGGIGFALASGGNDDGGQAAASVTATAPATSPASATTSPSGTAAPTGTTAPTGTAAPTGTTRPPSATATQGSGGRAPSTPQELHQALVAARFAPNELPAGFAFKSVEEGQPDPGPAAFRAVGQTNVEVAGPDAGNAVIYIVYPSAQDAQGRFNNIAPGDGATFNGTVTPSGFSGPARCYNITTTVSNQKAGLTNCIVLDGNVEIQGVSVLTSDTTKGNVNNATALARSGITHLNAVRGGTSSTGTPPPGTQPPSALTPQQLHDKLLATAVDTRDLPSGFSNPKPSKEDPTYQRDYFNALGEVDIDLNGPDRVNFIGYYIFTNNTDAKNYFDDETTVASSNNTGFFKPNGFTQPTGCKTLNLTLSGGTKVGVTSCYMLMDNVVIEGYSSLAGDLRRGNDNNATALLRSGLTHFTKVRGR